MGFDTIEIDLVDIKSDRLFRFSMSAILLQNSKFMHEICPLLLYLDAKNIQVEQNCKDAETFKLLKEDFAL